MTINGLECGVCKQRGSCFFSILKTESFDEFKRARIANVYKKRQIVFYEGHAAHGIYIVCSGRVKIYKTDNKGHQLTTRIVYPGDLLGYPALLSRQTYSATAESMENSWLAYLNEAKFNDLLSRYPVLTRKLLEHLARDMRLAEDKARDMAMKSSRERLAELLLGLQAGRDGNGHGNGRKTVLDVPFTRLDLAEMTGLAQETVIRLITELEEEKVIAVKGRKVTILNEEALHRHASWAT